MDRWHRRRSGHPGFSVQLESAHLICLCFHVDTWLYLIVKVITAQVWGMGGQLHIMQGYSTEATIHPSMGDYWTYALSGKTGVQANHTVIGAWNYVCRRTQPKMNKDPDQNICRSIFWPECQGDYVYGYGPQTDPSGGHLQVELQESDATANDPEP